MNNTKITSHRGLSDKFPENTLIAFKAAISAGSKRIELDVQESRDGKLYVHHDYYLGNPDNGKGLLMESEGSYIDSLSIFEKEHIPLFEDVLNQFGNNIEYEIELKGFNLAFIKKVVSLSRKYKVLNNIEFTSSNVPLLIKLKSLYPECKIGMFFQDYPGWMESKIGEELIISQLCLGNFDIAHCPIKILNIEFINKLHKKGYKVHAADCNTDEDLKTAFELNVDQLSTNYTEKALKIFGK